MNAILAVPIEARLAVLAFVGVLVGAACNAASAAFALSPRPHSPWSAAHPHDAGNRWLDRLPLWGWWRLRRKSAALGTGFWVRPLVVELGCAALFAGLYEFEVVHLGLLPPGPPPTPGTLAILHLVCLGHLLLVAFMLTASLIDLDDWIIPDAVTVPGTLLGLCLAAFCSWNLMPGRVDVVALGLQQVWFVHLVFPGPWPPLLDGFPLGGLAQLPALILGLACFWAWCLALLPRLWLPKRGLRKATGLFLAAACRSPNRPPITIMALVGGLLVTLVWWNGGHNWQALLSSLVGVAVGGGLIWAVRIVAGAVLGREAMGFGDVTLLAMIGSFLGWQACLLIFFLAPVAGLVLGIARVIFFRDREIPFGPFLCLAALGVIAAWVPLWDHLGPVFGMGWLVPMVMVMCMAMMAVLLGAWRFAVWSFKTLRSRKSA